MIESISSMNMTQGCLEQCLATVNRALTIFSPSPIHLLVREEAEMEKKVPLMLQAMALPINVLPVPGGLSAMIEVSYITTSKRG